MMLPAQAKFFQHKRHTCNCGGSFRIYFLIVAGYMDVIDVKNLAVFVGNIAQGPAINAPCLHGKRA
jgi:hypothetical protein